MYLEDEASMRLHTAEMLIEEKYDVECFRRIDLVKEFFQKNHDEVVCVVTDLNMADSWLGEYQCEADGCMLSGWVWLQRFVFPARQDMPTVIYSGYLSYLMEWLSKRGQLPLLEQSHIACVLKGVGEMEGFSGLLHALREILHI